ncbi:MAG: glycerol-3-phosphate dehydrogenase/oxidase [Candidatus Helarchaeota archaeon]
MSADIVKIKWSALDRAKYIQELRENTFDLLIIGGGITGAGIFRDITMRNFFQNKNLKIALVERYDFAYGTSNRSTKLAHGGIRYLAQGEFNLVKESENERDWLRNNIQNLVRPQAFIYAAYKKQESKSTIKLGLSIYDKLADYHNYKNYQWLSHEELAEIEPQLNLDTTVGKGAGIYYDTNINDARLTLETIKEGVYYGGLAVNYIKVLSLIKNESHKIIGVKVVDLLKNNEFEIKSKKIVNATGVWVDNFLENRKEKLIRPTKGVHIVVPKENVGCNNAVIVRSIDDNRHFFCIPRGNFILIGTTDTDYNGSYDEVYCTQEDSDYMTRSVKYYFPNAKLDNDQIISAYAGLRPLVREEGKSESEVSRKHIILQSKDGLVTITGGKLTIFRKMAEELIQKLINEGEFDLKFEEDFTKKSYLIGYNHDDWEKEKAKYNLDIDILEHLYLEYGKGINEIMEVIKNNPSLKDRIIHGRPFILAEFQYIIEHEFAPKLIDVLYRRSEVWMLIHPRYQQEIAEKVANLMAKYYNWSDEEKQKEVQEYLDEIYKNSFFYKKE